MTSELTTANIRGVLLDIEGTTTPISFVHEVLFSYARAALKDYLTAHWNSPEMVADLARLGDEHVADIQQRLDPPPLVKGTEADEIASVVAYLKWLIDRDRKSTVLKSLQGKIWRKGYLDRTLKAELFDDVPTALARWRNAGLSINIFSSGSELAQKLLFAHTQAGDFTSFIDNYFDTSIGSKTDVESYRRIAARVRLPAQSIVFISDVVLELDAANESGMQTLLCVRPGNSLNIGGEQFQVVHSFEGLLFNSHEK
jgi:enolase-phosphatase E1